MTFAESVLYLDALQRRKWHQGLGRMEKLVEVLGLESFVWGEERPKYFHVAGTNGKGSVCAFLQSILVSMAIPCGAAASPFVYDVRERVQLGNDLISEEEFTHFVGLLQQTDAQMEETGFGAASAFEMKTALGFLAWRERSVKAVALEVGLGGRLDATNVVAPHVCLIASIGWDHMDILGSTLGQIAAEKAGIIKKDIPVVTGRLPEEALKVICARAAELQCSLWRVGQEIRVEGCPRSFAVSCPAGEWTSLSPGLAGSIQMDNAALALSALAAGGIVPSQEEARRGVAEAWWPGRFERRSFQGLPLVLDGAHNLSAAENLRRTFKEIYPSSKLGLAVGMLRGHDPVPFLKALEPLQAEIRFVTAPGARGVPAEDLAATGFGPAMASMEEALMDLAQSGCEVLGVTGSFYILGEAKNLSSS